MKAPRNTGTLLGNAQRVLIGLVALCFIVGMFAAKSSQAQTFTVLYTFTGTGHDGSGPIGALVRDAAGNLYGMTESGNRTAACNGSGCGTVFKLDSSGHETILHDFVGGTDGKYPEGGLFRDRMGNLYGTTPQGGSYDCGTVFKIDTTGTEEILYNFACGSDGKSPYASFVQDGSGNLYSTTAAGGTFNQGTVFKLEPNGTESVLYSFAGGTDGAGPVAGLLLGASGTLYGTTQYGGSSGLGTVFQVDVHGVEKVLFSFGGANGASPGAGLIRDAAGNFYGTTTVGGASSEGTVFKLDPAGNETVLHSFSGNDGTRPIFGLIRDSQGNLYSTTLAGGSSGAGTIFKLDAKGTETVLYNFQSNGLFPLAGLTRGTAGNFYGTTGLGGSNNAGTVFEFTP